MTAATKKMSSAEYLAFELAAETRHEFVDGQIIAMAGASLPHNRIARNLTISLSEQLSGSGCEALTSDLKVGCLAHHAYYYPDIVILCGPEDLESSHVLLNPKVLMEILSPTTEAFDRGTKFRHYRSIPSLMEYVLIDQENAVIERYYVRQENQAWQLEPVIGLDAEMRLSSVKCSVPLRRIYQGVLDRTSEREDSK